MFAKWELCYFAYLISLILIFCWHICHIVNISAVQIWHCIKQGINYNDLKQRIQKVFGGIKIKGLLTSFYSWFSFIKGEECKQYKISYCELRITLICTVYILLSWWWNSELTPRLNGTNKSKNTYLILAWKRLWVFLVGIIRKLYILNFSYFKEQTLRSCRLRQHITTRLKVKYHRCVFSRHLEVLVMCWNQNPARNFIHEIKLIKLLNQLLLH
jgi:hypothetical protein